MKKDDAKQLRLRAERERTSMRLQILSAGIAEAMKTGFRCDPIEAFGPILEMINGELVQAIQEAQAAEDAYRPYWSRRSRRVTLRARPRRTLSKAVN
jgi:hypothetical protein